MQLPDRKVRATEVNIAARIGWPGAWTVEGMLDDGGIEQAVFAGPQSEARARRYAARRYRQF